MEFYVYILYSSEFDIFYYGQTKNLLKRLKDHNDGKSAFTKKYRPWELFAFKKVGDRKEAMKLEKMLKNLKAKSKITDFITKHGMQEVIGSENLESLIQ